MALIEYIEVCRVRTPLIEPYILSYGPVHVLDSIFCNVILEDGRSAWGESTPLPGYSSSDSEAAWLATRAAAKTAIGSDSENAWHYPENGDWFLTTALQTACEEACLPNETVGSVPLIGLVHAKNSEVALSSLEKARLNGHCEFKIKIGIQSAAQESHIVMTLQNILRANEYLRLDANQGLDLCSALMIAEVCDPGKVRYIEQPFPVCDWNSLIQLAKESPIPIALDESITDIASIEKTKQSRAASFIKLKWMKQGGPKELLKLVKHAVASDLHIIFGNGVATTWNNRQEAIFWLKNLASAGLAGEMNGFCKTSRSVPGLRFERGCAIVTPIDSDFRPFASEDVYDFETFGSRSAASKLNRLN